MDDSVAIVIFLVCTLGCIPILALCYGISLIVRAVRETRVKPKNDAD